VKPPVELSFVIPVYNGSRSIGAVTEQIHEHFSHLDFEIVLVNDGSVDDSEQVCQALVERHPETVRFVHLARNFGEHNAVLAGLNHASGSYVAVLDDDGQNPPREVLRMYEEIRTGNHDVVFGRYRVKRHSVFRNLGSRLNDRVANLVLGKPRDLYLSSFKLMNRFMVDEITRYTGPFPHIDGLILRATSNLGQIDVEHLSRGETASGYTLSKLFLLWLNIFLNFSIAPLRMATLAGVLTASSSAFLMVGIVVDKLYINPGVSIGIPTVLLAIVFFAGIQLVILGVIGEYLGRLFLDHSKSPQFTVRYVMGPKRRS
jgi:undecaprenyl-phosphate 4-deoxy-4-formamido-L-arabinose transferase